MANRRRLRIVPFLSKHAEIAQEGAKRLFTPNVEMWAKLLDVEVRIAPHYESPTPGTIMTWIIDPDMRKPGHMHEIATPGGLVNAMKAFRAGASPPPVDEATWTAMAAGRRINVLLNGGSCDAKDQGQANTESQDGGSLRPGGENEGLDV